MTLRKIRLGRCVGGVRALADVDSSSRPIASSQMGVDDDA
jgi:hypothetical protein